MFFMHHDEQHLKLKGAVTEPHENKLLDSDAGLMVFDEDAENESNAVLDNMNDMTSS